MARVSADRGVRALVGVCTAVLLGVVSPLAGHADGSAARTPSASAASSTLGCSQGATLNFVAHPDDDLLFLSPDLLHDILAGRCVRTVFVTAGDSDAGTGRMLLREAAVEAAYAEMAGTANSWATSDAGISGHPMPVVTLAGYPTVSLVFMRLPNAFADGSGAPSHNYETLQGLWQGTITQMEAIDGSSAYTRTTLIQTLTALMTAYSPDTIRTQDYVGSFGDGDHPDHHAAAYFVRAAHASYATPHVLTGYLDYPTSALAQNVVDPDLTAKWNAFNAYAAIDLICGNPPSCSTSDYAKWVPRQYTVGSETGGQSTSPPTISAFSPTSGPAGVSVTVTGTNFTGATGVRFNGSAAVFTVASASSITATVPSNATSGPVSVTTPGGSASSSGSFTVTTTTSAYRSTVLADAPAGYWRLGEAPGATTALDETNADPGSYLGAPALGQPGALSGDANTAVCLNGTSQYTQMPFSAALNPSAFSLEAWVNPTGGSGRFRSVLTSRDVGSSLARGYMLYASDANTWQLWLGTGSSYAKLYGPAVILNTWTHLVATYDGATARLYVNGALAATANLAYAANTTRPLRIGAGRTEAYADYYLPGCLDEIAVYPSALSATRIQAHYQAAKSS
jgi:LmbE family N-acetylglucosaminyl deacetylase